MKDSTNQKSSRSNIPSSIRSYSRQTIARDILVVSERTVDRLLKDGILKGFRVRGQIRITHDSVDALIRDNQMGVAE